MNINNLMEDAYASMYQPEEELSEEGEKDACYHKVKSRYNVWPSAYASGALVKCRAKGAKNWGNSAKKEEMEMVFAFLMNEGFASTEDDALAIIDSMSDVWYDSIMEELITEGMADKGVEGDEAMKRHGIKKHEGPMKVKKLPARKMRKGEGLGVKGRHSGVNRRGQAAVPVGKGSNPIEGGNGAGAMKPR